MAENSKNVDRFFKIPKVRTIASSSSNTFGGLVGLGASAVIDVSVSPLVTWTLQVSGDPVAATAWTVALEGSVDGISFTEILRHTTAEGDRESIFSGTTLFLASYYRINVIALTLGGATALDVHVVGKQ